MGGASQPCRAALGRPTICSTASLVLSMRVMNPHEGQHVLRGGAPVAKAKVALILIHGRGASAEDIYSLGEEVSAGAQGVALGFDRLAAVALRTTRLSQTMAFSIDNA